ncbi:MAG: carboxypeptidase regulatory-like domain-containing protein [Acidobacteria bacterium]|nr:carboxypeptidase regulatory-like domain-containing protein [Acidobacteriota bacterium]
MLKDANGKPIKHASVVLHGVDSKGRQLHEGIELKTDGDGKASAPAVPYGKVRVQVIATGMQTYGDDYDLSEPAREITVRLKPPQGQYSIYK